jgi:hypothetical protein
MSLKQLCMNPLQKLRYKTKVGLLLCTLLVGLLLNNMAGRKSILQIERTAEAIYVDRLMPSTFLFELREHLQQELALLESPRQDANTLKQQKTHQLAIASLVDKYEKTDLTSEERKEWNNLKLHLYRFHQERSGAYTQHFTASIRSLNHLNTIQAGEGKHLQANMHAIASESSLLSYFEIALILIIGTITLSLIGFSRNIFEQQMPRNPSLN